MIQNLLVLPNQLFHKIEELEVKNIIFYEAEEYFTKYNFNKKKLLLHRASMKNFSYNLKSNSNKINYYNYKKSLEDIIGNLDRLTIFDPINKNIKEKIIRICEEEKIELYFLENPNFLTSQKENADYFKENAFFQHEYYQMQRKRLNILVDSEQKPMGGKWSFDSKNRKKFPKNINIPKKPTFENDFIEEAKEYVKNNFSDNPGNLNNFFYPVNRKEAKKLLNNFIKNKLNNFGKYQDGFEKDIVIGFHSLISSSLNIGLLSPEEVVNEVLNYYEKNELPIESVEGFIRQIIGWREYVRALYDLQSENMEKSNYFDHNRDFPEKFYKGKSGINVLDDSINKALDYGYCHHIERLMVLGNFFLLTELDKDQVFNWFMEMALMLSILNKMNKDKLNKHIKIADKYLEVI